MKMRGHRVGLFEVAVFQARTLWTVLALLLVTTASLPSFQESRQSFQKSRQGEDKSSDQLNSDQKNSNQSSDKKRHPVPSKSKRRTLQTSIKALYRDLFSTRDPQEIIKGSRSLVVDAKATKDDLPMRFELYSTASDIFVEQFAVPEFESVTKQISDEFQLDFGEQLLGGFESMSKKVKDISNAKLLAGVSIKWTESFIQSKSYDLSKKSLRIYQVLGRKLRDQTIANKVKLVRRKISEYENIVDDFEGARIVLVSDKKNAAANFKAGKYFAVIENDFDESIKYFAISSDKKIKTAASSELANSLPAFEIASNWLDAGKRCYSELDKAMVNHAGDLFRKQVQASAGVKKRRIENALKEVQELLASTGHGGSNRGITGIWQVAWSEANTWKLMISDNGDVKIDGKKLVFSTQQIGDSIEATVLDAAKFGLKDGTKYVFKLTGSNLAAAMLQPNSKPITAVGTRIQD